MCSRSAKNEILKFYINSGEDIWITVHGPSMFPILQENNKTEEVETEVNLISVFEEQFARALSPIELNIIKDWKNCEYSDEMIIKALKEAVKSQVLNFRYIEGILSNWAKNGIKQRYIEQEEPKRAVPISEYKWWENE